MIVLSPAQPSHSVTFGTSTLSAVLSSIGTDDYDRACFEVFSDLDVDHWAAFHYRPDHSVRCVATDSTAYKIAAKENCDRFANRYHGVDPSILALRGRRETTVLTKIGIGDIRDHQYRHCFELTHVQERLSYFSRSGSNLHQLSIFRGPGKRSFTASEMGRFATLANVILVTMERHEVMRGVEAGASRPLNVEEVERLLIRLPGSLSKREREVCSRAAVGITIEGTALDLNIQKTSVITYRQRAYQKLGITRQNELVAMVNNLRADSH